MYEGGIYEVGFKIGLICVINDYVRKKGFIKENDLNLSGDDVREGLIVIILIKYFDL